MEGSEDEEDNISHSSISDSFSPAPTPNSAWPQHSPHPSSTTPALSHHITSVTTSTTTKKSNKHSNSFSIDTILENKKDNSNSVISSDTKYCAPSTTAASHIATSHHSLHHPTGLHTPAQSSPLNPALSPPCDPAGPARNQATSYKYHQRFHPFIHQNSPAPK